MWIAYVTEKALEVLVPSWGEINVSLAAAVLLVLVVSILQHTLLEEHQGDKSRSQKGVLTGEFENDGSRFSDLPGHDPNSTGGTNKFKEVSSKAWDSAFIYVIRLELLAAKNLIAANFNGTSDPYAIITCGEEKRFSSMVQGSRNPMWGEEFDFYTEDLPVEVKVSIHDWDIVWKSTCLGSMTLLIEDEGQTEAIWHALDSTSGQVCVQTVTKKYPVSSSGSLNGFAGTLARKRFTEKPIGTEVRQKPGPLQTIFRLPPDECILRSIEGQNSSTISSHDRAGHTGRFDCNLSQSELSAVVQHSYSCALERSFLYHGRMFVSRWHICFHSNVFSKQLKVVLPYEDIEEIKRSQHAFINPAITIVLRAGSGGHGVPPLASTDGRAKYKFASYWNRNHVHRALIRAALKFREMQDAAQQEQKQSSLRAQSSSFRNLEENNLESTEVIPPTSLAEVKNVLPFIKDDALTEILKVDLPAPCEKIFGVCYSNASRFTESFRAQRKDTELQIENWHPTEQYSGENRKITFRALCNNPMCPPDSAMTEYQHSDLSEDRKTLLIETVQQCHDIPFGSYFEVHAKWTFESTSDKSCSLVVKVGAHFKKWCVMQGKIKSGTVSEYKGEAKTIIEVMRKFLDEADVVETELTTANYTGDDLATGGEGDNSAPDISITDVVRVQS